MKYIFDTNSIRVMNNYYPEQFPSFWEKINIEANNDSIGSVDQVLQELHLQNLRPHVEEWINTHKTLFRIPTSRESIMVAEIYKIPKFQESLKLRKRLEKGPFADPWIIAAAAILGTHIVSEETNSPNGCKIPNIAQHFNIKCMSLQEYMAQHHWKFE
jgi:hypothetical protein